MNLKGCYLHNSDDWETPTELYKHFINDLECIDPCPLHSIEDNLSKITTQNNIYINPPYSKIKEWGKFIENNLKYENTIYLLIPARTDTKYFHELMSIDYNIELYFIKGRLKFGNSKNSAPFPSVLIKFSRGGRNIKTYFIEQKDLLNIK